MVASYFWRGPNKCSEAFRFQANIKYPSSILVQKETLHDNQVDVAILVSKRNFSFYFTALLSFIDLMPKMSYC